MLIELTTLKRIISHQGKKLYEMEKKDEEIEKLNKTLKENIVYIKEVKLLNDLLK